MRDMTDHDLAQRLLAVVGSVGDGARSAIAAGEDVIAIAELVELAATNHIAVPNDLLFAVRQLADEGASSLDADDIAALHEDIGTLALMVLSA